MPLDEENTMTTMIVPIKLKDGADPAEYEKWAQERDIPTATSLPTVDSFHLYRVASLIDGNPAPYDYVEVIEINDIENFPKDVASEPMQKIAEELGAFLGDGAFLLSDRIA
jgi:hypothetical protein